MGTIGSCTDLLCSSKEIKSKDWLKNPEKRTSSFINLNDIDNFGLYENDLSMCIEEKSIQENSEIENISNLSNLENVLKNKQLPSISQLIHQNRSNNGSMFNNIQSQPFPTALTQTSLQNFNSMENNFSTVVFNNANLYSNQPQLENNKKIIQNNSSLVSLPNNFKNTFSAKKVKNIKPGLNGITYQNFPNNIMNNQSMMVQNAQLRSQNFLPQTDIFRSAHKPIKLSDDEEDEETEQIEKDFKELISTFKAYQGIYINSRY